MDERKEKYRERASLKELKSLLLTLMCSEVSYKMQSKLDDTVDLSACRKNSLKYLPL